jgi:hypothetical protein
MVAVGRVNGEDVPAVQRADRPGRRAVGGVLLTGLAVLLVLLAFSVPDRLEDLGPTSFVRLPLEALVFVAVVLALPPGMDRLRTGLALAAGVLLGLVAVLKLLDVGFLEALNRPFDLLIDWRYAAPLAETLRSSVGDGLGTVLLAAAVVLAVALLVLVPLSVLRLTRVAARHRQRAAVVVAALSGLWLVLALTDVRGAAGPVAARDTSGYVYGQISRIPSELRDFREFAAAAEADPYRGVPAGQLLTSLRGKDVLVVFVESYGRIALEDPALAPGVGEVLATGNRQLADAGFSSRSAFLTSPTFGALSWLAHATLQSGLWVDSQQRYDAIVTSPRLTLSRLFGRAGWRTVLSVPANNRDWPQGEWYGFDHVYDSRNVGYRGPRFGYPTMPDQYTLDAFHRFELAAKDRRPVMAEIDLITSHAPWSRTPHLVDQTAVGDGSVFDGMPETLPSEPEIWPDPDRVRAAYGDAVEYSLSALVRFLTTYGDDDLVVVMLGDHQPATIVSGPDAGRDVPVSVLSRDPAVLDAIAGWGWDDGLRPGDDAPVWPMDQFRDRFLRAYGPGDTGAAAGGRR